MSNDETGGERPVGVSRRGVLKASAVTLPAMLYAADGSTAGNGAGAPLPAGGADYGIEDAIRFHAVPKGGSIYEHPPERMRYVFQHMTQFMRHGAIRRVSTETVPLPAADANAQAVARHMLATPLGEMSLDDYVRDPGSNVDAAIVLHGGRVAYESYPRMRPQDGHILWSVTKSFVGLLVAILAERGLVDTERSIDAYIEEFRDSGWEGVRIRDVLDMASGIDARESDEEGSFTDPEHPYFRFEASIGYLPGGHPEGPTTYDIVASYGRRIEPGTVYEYTSVNSFALAWLVERMGGYPLHEMISREIWSRIGAQSDAVITQSPHGAPGADGGISCTLRDLARFGLIYTDAVREAQAKPIVSDRHLATVQTGGRRAVYEAGLEPEDSNRAGGPLFNSWQWDDVWRNGDLYKGGWGGQGLFVSPARNTVVAFFGTPGEGRQINALPDLVRDTAEAFGPA